MSRIFISLTACIFHFYPEFAAVFGPVFDDFAVSTKDLKELQIILISELQPISNKHMPIIFINTSTPPYQFMKDFKMAIGRYQDSYVSGILKNQFKDHTLFFTNTVVIKTTPTKSIIIVKFF